MSEKKTGVAVAAMISAALIAMMFGILFVFAEGNDPVHDFLEFNSAMGTLSGKIAVSYSVGAALFIFLGFALRNRNPSIMRWMAVSIALILLATLLSYTPFIKLFLSVIPLG